MMDDEPDDDGAWQTTTTDTWTAGRTNTIYLEALHNRLPGQK